MQHGLVVFYSYKEQVTEDKGLTSYGRALRPNDKH